MDYRYAEKAIEEDILRSLDKFSPVTDYFTNLERTYNFVFRKELVDKRAPYFRISEPQTVLIGEGECISYKDTDLYNQLNLKYKEIPLYPLVISELFSETLFYSKSYLTPKFKFGTEFISLLNKTLEHRAILTEASESTLILSDPQVSVSHDICTMGVHVSIRQNIGVCLSTIAVDKLKNRWCCDCSRRLKCSLIPEKLCNLSWMVSR